MTKTNEFGNTPPHPVPVKLVAPTHTPMRKFRHVEGESWNLLGRWVGNDYQQWEITPDNRVVLVTYHAVRPSPAHISNLELPTLATWKEINHACGNGNSGGTNRRRFHSGNN